MTNSDVIRVKEKHKKMLWHYKIENGCKSLSDAIGHALQRLDSSGRGEL